jgi:uncharacterized protein (TIGR00290 family)
MIGVMASRSEGSAPGARDRLWMAWSSGKDSAFALHLLRQQADVEVCGLLTTVNETHGRVAMHAVRRELLQAQADALGLPLIEVPIPYPCSNEVYEAAMAKALDWARAHAVTGVAFGDLFLTDIRAYRERQMAPTGLSCHFPLWGRPTPELAHEMVATGFRARLTCIDPKALPASFAGREFDAGLLEDLPPAVDPCGENGEFHTFVWDGPSFSKPVKVRSGEVVARDGFVFADLLPA